MSLSAQFTPLSSLLGGALIGLSASLLLALNGRIAGISGIAWNAVRQQGQERRWRLTFIAGLLVGAMAWFQFGSGLPAPREHFPLGPVVLAGLLVGFGTRVGGGCTSGHGICGLARWSRRSFAAVAMFMACGMLTATMAHHVFG